MLFDRVYKLIVGKAGGQGFEVEDLRITFDIQKTVKKTPNTGSIKVWNLKKETRSELEKEDTKVILHAGYKEDAGPLLIFSGGVTHAWSKIEGPDIITEFELGDGTQEMRDTTISVGYAGKVKSKTVLADVAKKMGLPLTMPSNIPEREWAHGLSYYGHATGLLNKVVQGTGLEWSVQNGNLQVLEKGMVTTRQGIELAVDSGLIHSPERIKKAKTSTKKAKKDKPDYEGWNIKTLLMPTINPGDRVKLTSRFVTGVFRVHEIKHNGDSHSGDWISEMKVVDPAAPLSDEKATKAAKGGVAKSDKSERSTKGK